MPDQMSLKLNGGILALRMCAIRHEAGPSVELNRWLACPCSDKEEEQEEPDTNGRTDGHQGCGAMGWRRSDRVKQDFLPIVRHCVPERSRKDFLFFRLRLLPPCHHTPTSQIY